MTKTQTHPQTQTCAFTLSHMHTNTQMQHGNLQDKCKRFIFRPLGPLLCPGFTERMRELSCPLLAFEWGVGLLLWPQAEHACLSVGQSKDGLQQRGNGYKVVANICDFPSVKHSSLLALSQNVFSHCVAFQLAISDLLISRGATCSFHVANS